MKLIKNFTACVAALAVAAGAHAATFGSEANPYLVGAGGLNFSEVNLPDSGVFSDSFFFKLAGGAGAQAGVTSFFWGESLLDAPGLSFKLSGAGLDKVLNPTPFLSDNNQTIFAATTFTGLKTNVAYNLTIAGTDASNLGQTYGFQIAAVPEPETYAMLMAGLALVSGVVRRRKRAN